MRLTLLTTVLIFASQVFGQNTNIKVIRPSSDDIVIEKLGPRLQRPASNQDVAPMVRQYIALARQHADPRYLGYAQKLIGAQWSNPKASHELLTLQATIEQSRHEFDQARKTLKLALEQPAPTHAQAWLTLATIERVQGQYKQAEQACHHITASQAQFYVSACLLETQSLQGQWDQARAGLAQLQREIRLPIQQAWLNSLMAENELRAGQSATALKLFALSLSQDNDGYTALAYADALLEVKQAVLALAVLQNQPQSDAVLIRQAQAYKQLNDPRLANLRSEINQRLTSLNQRDNATTHAREMALFALYVQSDAQLAYKLAQINLKLQREPIDWLIAIQSAMQAGLKEEKAKLLQAATQSGLRDSRLK